MVIIDMANSNMAVKIEVDIDKKGDQASCPPPVLLLKRGREMLRTPDPWIAMVQSILPRNVVKLNL